MRIATWKNLAGDEAEMLWFRQAPACMYEDGKIHPGLAVGGNAHWGATLDGDTVIRRSGIGLRTQQGDVLYVAITNHTTARAIADGMHHAGAADVAQLDVNWSYPKFVLFEAGSRGGRARPWRSPRASSSREDEYIRKRSLRDFFYLMRKRNRAHERAFRAERVAADAGAARGRSHAAPHRAHSSSAGGSRRVTTTEPSYFFLTPPRAACAGASRAATRSRSSGTASTCSRAR